MKKQPLAPRPDISNKRKYRKRCRDVISFGRHKGQTLQEVPVDYLKWMVKKLVDDDDWAKWWYGAKNEIKIRKQQAAGKQREEAKGLFRVSATPVPEGPFPVEECPF